MKRPETDLARAYRRQRRRELYALAATAAAAFAICVLLAWVAYGVVPW